MIERAIENWLINTNEKNYTLPFCQTLINEGHKILHISSHGPGEFGKDIITIDSEGDVCVYQLNTGNITKSRWLSKLHDEIIELTELPPKHPALTNNGKIHKAFLVTNGEIAREVKEFIDQMNLKNVKKKTEIAFLNIIDLNLLLSKFIEAQGDFLPKQLNEFYTFLSFYLDDGRGFISKEKFFNFLNNTIFNEISGKISNIRNAISSSIIISSYLLNPYQQNENHFALFEAWTLLAACILCYSKKNNLKNRDWKSTWDIITYEIERNLTFLRDETLGREDLIEGNPIQDGGLILRGRTTILLGTLAAFEIYLKIKNPEYVINSDLIRRIKEITKVFIEAENEEVSPLWFWGESAFPFFFYIIKLLELFDEKEIANLILQSIFNHGYIFKFIDGKKLGVANPYYNIQDHLAVRIGINPNKINFRQFYLSSYIIEVLILMIARRDGRRFLDENWRKISYFRFNEFIPDKVEDYFSWLVKDGGNHSSYPNQTQSWNELRDAALNLGEVPEIISENMDFLILFSIICPHRINKHIIISLEDLINNL